MKKNVYLIVFFIFMINNQAYSYSHDECSLIQRDTSIILANIESQAEYVLMNISQII